MTSIFRESVVAAVCCWLALLATAQARAKLDEDNFSFPTTRRGRASSNHLSPLHSLRTGKGNLELLDSIAVSKALDKDDEILKKLIDTVMREAAVLEESPRSGESGGMAQAATSHSGFLDLDPENRDALASLALRQMDVNDDDDAAAGVDVRPLAPRRVDEMAKFGSSIEQANFNNFDNLPQLADRSGFLTDPEPAKLDLFRLNQGFAPRQSSDDGNNQVAPNDEVRCIPKVMQVEETVYDRAIKCHHSFQEKCHMTYITDYKSSTEEKCETTFVKNCHITFKAMPFNETVNVCFTPLVRKCGGSAVGPDICSTHYETSCETRYKTYEVEQDEPVCKMELMKKCQDVSVSLPDSTKAPDTTASFFRKRRQIGDDTTSGTTPAVTQSTVTSADGGITSSAVDNVNPTAPPTTSSGDTLKIDQNCEEWPVQKCSLEKKTVRKVHPDTECRKIPREVCVPNNCGLEKGDDICRDEVRMQIQNVPEEECELQPEESCHAEAVLVPRLVPKQNCVKVPREICVNTKTNPRRVKKPIVKEWCYKPSDLRNNPDFTLPAGMQGGASQGGRSSRSNLFV